MSTKTDIVHFHNGSGGGVLSVITNIIRYSKDPSLRHHVIFTIDQKKQQHYKIPLIEDVISTQVFYYNGFNNFYYTCQQLSQLIPGKDAILVAHDWLELGMMSHLGIPNRLVFFLHGDYEYYYDLAKKHEAVIDTFITVSESIYSKLIHQLPNRKDTIFYKRFPVPAAAAKRNKTKPKIVFIGRLEEGKGYHLLPLIANSVHQSLPALEWHIIGSTNSDQDLLVSWNQAIQVIHWGNIPNEQVQELLAKMFLYILPSQAEGMPVSLIEAMKAGVVPIVNDLEGGVQELVKENETGFKIKHNDVEAYANVLHSLFSDVVQLERMAKNASELANQLFDPIVNTKQLEACLVQSNHGLVQKQKNKVYGSRLDQPWLPNWLVAGIRKLQ